MQHAAPGTALATACLAAALVFTAAAEGRATRDRPPPGYTGGFGEPTCTQCHIDAAPNTGGGTLHVAGLPSEYRHSQTYILEVVVAQTGLSAAGFELTVRFADGGQAGSLSRLPADSLRIDVTTAGDIAYIHHLYEGTYPTSTDTARWQIEWRAPESGDAVVLHAAANASDGDSSPIGDFIYTTSITSTRVPR